MDKNTIIAIALSTVVIVAAFVLQPLLFPNAFGGKNSAASQQVEEVVNTETTETTENNVANLSDVLGTAETTDGVEESTLVEETFTVVTDRLEVVLTNRGGDIISYELRDHVDTDTGRGMQLADNVTDINRACAVSLGNADSRIINDVFEVEKIDDYTYLFKKTIIKNGQKVTLGKRYTFKDGEYVFKLDVLIHCDDAAGLNFNDAAYTIRTSPQIGPHYNQKANRYEYRQYVTYDGNKYRKQNLSNGQFKNYEKPFIWEGIAGKYFIDLIVPENESIVKTGYFSTEKTADYQDAQAFLERRAFSGSDIQDTYYMYYGPRNEKELKRYNVAENNAWGFGGKKLSQALQTSGWLSWLEKILKWGLEMLHKIIPNWGICIIIMTIILKALMFPLSKKQSMGTLKMQEVQPQLTAIQEKYKGDQQRIQAETAKLYKEAGYNPAAGCLPMLFQFLVLFAMYNLFNNYFEFRGSSFIPHWIPDLSVGDSVWAWEKNIPLISGFTANHLRILPVIYVATQLLFGKITQYGGAGGTGANAASMKFMTYGMPIMFFFLFYNAPSGLLLYWIVSNVFQMGQQIIINKMMAKKKAEMKGAKLVDENRKLPPKAKAMEKKRSNTTLKGKINKKI